MNEQLKTDIRQLLDDTGAIKNAVVAMGVEVPDGTPSSLFADKVVEVYEKGKSAGSEDGGDTEAVYSEGYEQGKEAERIAFWEVFQEGGKRTNYSYSMRSGFTDENFFPIYPFATTTPGDMNNAFAANLYLADLKQPIVIEGTGRCQNPFFNARNIVTIPSLTIGEGVTIVAWFGAIPNLVTCIVHGTIASNGFAVNQSPLLSHESLISIINALKDYSEDTSGTEWVVTIGNTNKAKLTADEIAVAQSKGWTVN